MRNESHNGHKDIAIVTPEHANNTKAIIEASENEREVIMDCYCCRGVEWTGRLEVEKRQRSCRELVDWAPGQQLF